MRLINEDAVMEIIERVTNEAVEKNQRKYLIQPRIIAEIAGLPTIEAEPVKYGRWVRKHNSFPQRYFCTECGGGDVGRFAFCHHCGARMRMDGDGDE